jgi:hypothetical protein
MSKRIGFVVSHETEFASAVIARLEAEPALEAELVTISGVTERPLGRWDVIVDGASARVPHYRAWLRAMALAGVTVVNDPFVDFGADRFFALAAIARAGVNVPRAVLLPQHSYAAGVDHAHGLRNLEHPLRWHEIARYVRFPAWLRPIDGGLDEAQRVHDLDAVWRAFDHTGERVCALQAAVGADLRLRGIAVGGELVLLEGGPGEGFRPFTASAPAAVEAVQRATRTLGTRLAAIDLALSGDECWVVDTGPGMPSLEPSALGEAFESVVDAAAVGLVRVARSGRSTLDEHAIGERVRGA